MPAILSVKNLYKTYRTGLFKEGFQALKNVSLDVGRGSVIGLLGPNGAGKTTLVKVLLGLVRYESGDASLFGQPVGRPAVRTRVGYLPEAHRLPDYLTGRQILRLFAMMCGRPRSWIEPRIDGWLDRVSMREDGDRKVREYSKGMQQRIGLAQALIHEPELIFLDEPTDGVDPVGRRDIRDIISGLQETGATIFINSHLLLEVQRMCDDVIILHRGEILKRGTVEDLTLRTGIVRFDVKPYPPDLSELLQGLGGDFKRIPEEDAFEVSAEQEVVDRIVDRLRERGISVCGIASSRLTLEESFIDLVQGGAA